MKQERLVAEQSAETTVSTFCRICESRCGIEVTVNKGRVSRIGPDKQNPYTWRDFCSKGRSAGKSSIILGGCVGRFAEPRTATDGPPGRTRPRTSQSVWPAYRERHGPDAIALYLGNPVGFNGANGAWFSALARGLKTKNLYSVSSVDQNNLQRVCHEMYGRWLIPLHPRRR